MVHYTGLGERKAMEFSMEFSMEFFMEYAMEAEG